MKNLLVLYIFLLTGCTTMLTHIPLTHIQTISLAEELATYDSCADQGYASKQASKMSRHISPRLHSS